MPTYDKVNNFLQLKKEAFQNTFVFISDSEGSQKEIKARICNLKMVNNGLSIYVTSPPINDICEPEWHNRITILMCGGNNVLCMVMSTKIIDDFENKFHIEPTGI